MAVIPRYFSGANPTPAINTVRADPSVAAAPYRAQEQSTASLMNQFQHEISSWQQLMDSKDKVQGEEYAALASNELTRQARELRSQIDKSAGSPEEAQKIYQEKYAQLADSVINSAPNQQSKLSLIKSSGTLGEGQLEKLGSEVKAFQKDVARTQKEQQAALEKDAKVKSGLSAADALAKLQINSNVLHQELLKNPDPNINMANEFDVRYQKMVDEALVGVTDNHARTEILKKAIPLRAQMYNTMHNTSVKKNNQENMTAIENTLLQYESLASKSPDALPLVKENSRLLFDSMAKLGVPPAQREKIQQTFYNNLDYHALRTTAEKDPQTVLQSLNDPNAFPGLKGSKIDAIRKVADSSLKSYQTSARKALADAESRIYSGQAIPDDLETRLAAGMKYGLEDDVSDLEGLARIRNMTKGQDYTNIVDMKRKLEMMLSKGEIDLPARKAEKLMKYVDGQAASMQKDPISHGEREGLFAPLPPVTDFTSIDPREIEARRFRADQAASAYGVEAPMFRDEEMVALQRQLDTAPIKDKLAIMKNLSSLDSKTIDMVASKVRKADPTLAHAMRLGNFDDDTAMRILKGQEALATKAVPSPTKDEVYEASSKALGNMLADDPDSRASLVQAGRAYYAHEQLRGNQITLDEAMKKAGNIVEVSRGHLLWKNKYSTVAPAPGMDGNSFDKFTDDRLSNLDAWTKYSTGIPARTEDNLPMKVSTLKGSDLEYHYRDDGKYDIMYEGKRVLTENGTPSVIDLRKLYQDK